MKFVVWWRGADGGKVDTAPCSLANAIESALDFEHRGEFLYITDANGKRLTLKAAQRLRASADAERT